MSTISIEEWKKERAIRLTRREKDVTELIVEGLKSREVADILFVSKRTVDFHIARVYEKLQVKNRVQLFNRVLRLGLVVIEQAA